MFSVKRQWWLERRAKRVGSEVAGHSYWGLKILTGSANYEYY